MPRTSEVVVGMEREIINDFGVSFNYTYRRMTDFNWFPYVGVTGSDYTQTGTFTGSTVPIGPYSVPYYSVSAAAATASASARTFTGRDGYHQEFKGWEVAGTKRMSHNWMMRMGFSHSDHREFFDTADGKADPTSSVPSTSVLSLASPNINGGTVLTPSGGSGKSNIYLAAPKYQYILTVAYNMKYGINAGFNYLFRQGYAMPFFQSRVAGTSDALSGTKTLLLVSDVNGYRLPNVHSGDARLSKAIVIKGTHPVNIHLDLDVFNLFNTATQLGRGYDVRLTNFNKTLEIMNPRIFRLGARIGF